MKESVTYQAILEEGAVRELQERIMELGTDRWSAPDKSAETALRSITDVERLRRIHRALLRASSWKELLSTP